MTREQEEQVGWRLAELGGQIYSLADSYPAIEETEDFGKIMHYLNKLSYRLIYGREQEGASPK